jgi:hypothetical protein
VIKTNKKLILITFIGIILLSNVVLAIPGIPHQFYGSVTYNGQSAPDGLSVVAKINGVEVASTTTSGGRYGYSPIFYVEDPMSDRSGKTINFFVNGVDTGQTAVFQNGGITRLDLTTTGPSVVTTTPTQISSGDGGGGDGGSQTTTTISAEEKPVAVTTQGCQEKWTCTKWSACKNSIQTRTCTDENNCGTDLYRPFESQPCGQEQIAEERSFDGFTGLVTLITTPVGLGLIVIVVIAIISFFIIRRRT